MRHVRASLFSSLEFTSAVLRTPALVAVVVVPPCDTTTEIATIAAITNNRNPAPMRYICKGKS
jgi:hypothetical protein